MSGSHLKAPGFAGGYLLGMAADLAWPVPSPDGLAVYALRGRQVVRIVIANGQESALGAPAEWRKLIGVLSDGTLLGFIEDDPRPRPALLAPDGGRLELPPPANDVERERNGALLQERRDYADGTRLEVRDSERGRRGHDVFLVGGSRSGNLTDCGDDLCGQPSRSSSTYAGRVADNPTNVRREMIAGFAASVSC